MSLPLPTSMSPSKVSTFKDCALAFRYSAIDKLPQPPSMPAIKGTLVHRALELMFVAPAAQRTPEFGASCLAAAMDEMTVDPEYLALALDEDAAEAFRDDATTMLGRYFQLEDPTVFEPVGIELMLSAQIGGLLLRGIIDRLDLDANGDLIVTDYKTGRAPSEKQELSRLGGVHFYAYLCEQVFGKRPAKVQLMYLGASPQIIVATPTAQSTSGLERRVQAIWTAVERACENDDFRPKPSNLCNWCSYKEYCPAFGGDPAKAASLSVVAA